MIINHRINIYILSFVCNKRGNLSKKFFCVGYKKNNYGRTDSSTIIYTVGRSTILILVFSAYIPSSYSSRYILATLDSQKYIFIL